MKRFDLVSPEEEILGAILVLYLAPFLRTAAHYSLIAVEDAHNTDIVKRTNQVKHP